MEVLWKCWHRSFNQWIVRYIYLPLGGSRVPVLRRVLNVILVFTYVAIWHDINLKLLSWSWLICLAFGPELIVRSIFKQSRFDRFRSSVKFRFLCVFGSTFTAMGMVIGNLVGFAFGLEGLRALLVETPSVKLWQLLIIFLLFLYALLNVVLWMETLNDGVQQLVDEPDDEEQELVKFDDGGKYWMLPFVS